MPLLPFLPRRKAVLACCLLILSFCLSSRAAAAALQRWRFQEDFAHGIPGWVSYPFPQDIGYDPSLYTQAGALVRDVVDYGERDLKVGVLRPIAFHANADCSFHISYELVMSGTVTRAELILGATNGRRYTAALPAGAGPHTVQIGGAQLKLMAAGADIEAVVIEVSLSRPVLGSRNRLFVRAFGIEAERPPALRLPRSEFESSAVNDSAVLRAVQAPGTKPDVRRLKIVRWEGEGKGPGLWTAEAAAEGATADFRYLALNQVPPHPRVLLRQERLAQIASDAALSNAVHQRAAQLAAAIAYNREAGHNISLLSRDSLLAGVYPYLALMGNYGDAAAFNALDYRLRGETKSLEAARRAILAVANWGTWTPPWFAARGLHTYYAVGEMSRTLAFGYDLIADHFSAAEKGRFAEAALRNSIEPTVDEYFAYDLMPTAASNHMSMSVGGAIALAIALYGDVPDSERRFGPALAKLIYVCERQLDGAFSGDGSESEPAGYSQVAVGGLSWGLAALDRIGVHPHGLSRLLDSMWWLQYARAGNDLVLCTGDTGDTMGQLGAYGWAAEYGSNPVLRALYDSSRRVPAGRRGRGELELLSLACCSRPAPPVPELPPSRVFNGRGSAALRSGWGSDATVISIRVGPWFNHEHHDQGSFQVAAFGQKLIAEAGYSAYYTDPRFQDYFVASAGHNTVLVDDDPFSQGICGARYWRAFSQHPQFVAQDLARQYDYLAADLKPAYGSRVESYTREFVFIKPDVLIVRDHLRSAKPHRYTWLLHVPAGAVANTDGTQASIRAASAGLALTSASGHWTLKDSPIPIGDYQDLDRGTVRERREFRLESESAREVTFLVGMRFGKAGLESLQPTTDGFQAGEVSVAFRGTPAAGAQAKVIQDGRRITIRWK